MQSITLTETFQRTGRNTDFQPCNNSIKVMLRRDKDFVAGLALTCQPYCYSFEAKFKSPAKKHGLYSTRLENSTHAVITLKLNKYITRIETLERITFPWYEAARETMIVINIFAMYIFLVLQMS